MSNVPTNLIPSTITQLPDYTGGSTAGYLPYSINGRTYKVQFSSIAAVGAVPSSRTIATGNGLQGGGDLSQDRTISIITHGVGYSQLDFTGVVAGTYGGADTIPAITVDDTGRITAVVDTPVVLSNYVPSSRTVTAGAGLTGGGQLDNNITISLNPSNANPQPLGSASPGAGTEAARDDHVHPAVDLTDVSQTQGVLPLGRGGTGVNLTPTVGAVIYADNDSFNQTTAGDAGQVLKSAGGLSAPYWDDLSSGTVTSVAASGGTTGLSFSGSPITTSGTLTLGGTLVVANGGTGATTASAARTNLGAAASGANSDITSMSGITGAIATPDYIDMDTGATVTPALGRLWWDGNTTLQVGMTANVTGQVNETLYVYIKASAAITKGQVIVQDGTVGASGVLKAKPAPINTSDAHLILGIAAEDIALNGFGLIQTHGYIKGLNTSGSAYGETWADEDQLYYNPAYVGGLTNVKPTAPDIKLPMCEVVKAGSGSSGSLYVNIGASSKLGGTDENVQFGTLTDKDLIQYDSALLYWKNVAPSSVTVGAATNIASGAANQIPYQTGAGATSFIAAPTSANTFLEWSGTAFQWSTVSGSGTVTSVAASGGTTGLSFSGSPITTSGTLTLSGTLAVANGGTGQTSYTDGQLLIGNTTGNTLTKSTLTAGSGISITNGSGSITIAATGSGSGTVTSVAATVPTGFTITGSPITTSGTLAIAFDTGYSLPTTSSQSNWDTAYTDRLKWDGGATGLTASTGRTSLGATTVGANIFTLTDPSAITFLRINADNSVSALSASDFRTAIGAGTGSGTVTSVDVSGGTTGLTTSGGPVTGSGTITLAGTLAVANGGTGQTSYTDGQLLIGNTTGNTLTKATLTAGTNVSITNGSGSITINATDQYTGTVTSVSALTIGTTGTDLSSTVANSTTTPVITLNVPTASATNRGALSSADWSTFNGKQDALVSGTNIKTVNSNSLLGSGDVSVGTVTSVAALTLGTTGTDLSSTVATGTTTPVITLNVPTASASNRGALSSTDWSTFNGKQAALVSGTNIKTVSGTSLLGSGDLGTIGVAYGGTGATTLTGLVVGNGTSAFTTVTAPSGTVVGTTDTQTLTNKRVTPRVNAQTTTTSPWAWNSDSYDQQSFSALANALTINADAGTPNDGQKTLLRFKDNASARVITFTGGASKAFRDLTGQLTVSGSNWTFTTTASKTVYFGCVYNGADSRWDIIALTAEP